MRITTKYATFVCFILAFSFIVCKENSKRHKTFSKPVEEAPEVVKIVELFRHGSRQTLYNIFNEESVAKNIKTLNATGMHQHYSLGKKIKKKYPHLFSEKYDWQQISI